MYFLTIPEIEILEQGSANKTGWTDDNSCSPVQIETMVV